MTKVDQFKGFSSSDDDEDEEHFFATSSPPSPKKNQNNSNNNNNHRDGSARRNSSASPARRENSANNALSLMTLPNVTFSTSFNSNNNNNNISPKSINKKNSTRSNYLSAAAAEVPRPPSMSIAALEEHQKLLQLQPRVDLWQNNSSNVTKSNNKNSKTKREKEKRYENIYKSSIQPVARLDFHPPPSSG